MSIASLGRSAVILVYSLLMIVLLPTLRVLARFNPKLRAQLEGRKSSLELAKELARPRATKKRCAVFFCSSAGEYEQARPLIERMTREPDAFVHVFFFSRSGYEFARARGESGSFSLCPALDSVWHWGHLFSALRPDVVIVVRHELWPGFLETARHFGSLYLIDASRSIGEAASRAKRIARGQLLRYFDRIYVVSEDDATFFRQTYALDAERVVVAGDTKYDRVLERARAKMSDKASIAEALRSGGKDSRLVLGSAHKPDVELWLEAWRSLGDATRGWQVVIAPHHVDAETVGWMKARCESQGLSTILHSTLLQQGESVTSVAPAQVVIVDAMGKLAEIYGVASMAFVGGAVHHQVHNVLEPACHGLALAFGPFYKNSQEAVHLVNVGLAKVCGDASELAAWWRLFHSGDSGHRSKLAGAVANLGGATDRIMTAIAVHGR